MRLLRAPRFGGCGWPGGTKWSGSGSPKDDDGIGPRPGPTKLGSGGPKGSKRAPGGTAESGYRPARCMSSSWPGSYIIPCGVKGFPRPPGGPEREVPRPAGSKSGLPVVGGIHRFELLAGPPSPGLRCGGAKGICCWSGWPPGGAIPGLVCSS